MSCQLRVNLLSSTALIGVISTVLQTSAAQAECLPGTDPVSDTIICSGTDSDTYVSSGTGLVITNASDATMTGGPAFTLSGNFKTLINEGVIQSDTIGINNFYNLTVENTNLISGTDYGILSQYSTLSLINGTDGIIRGNIAIATSENYYGFDGTLEITNSGLIEGTGGYSIYNPYDVTLTNEETGQIIGGIHLFRTLNIVNAGLIDGGQNAAINHIYYFGYGSLDNSGTITSAISDGNAVQLSYTDVTNSGTIEATGANGTALFIGSGTLTNSGTIISSGTAPTLNLNNSILINEEGGEIISAGWAIDGRSPEIINKGSIVGDVTITLTANYGSTTYRDMGGTITGNLNLGNGNDFFLYDYETGSGLSSVSGTVDPGEGFDSYGVTAEGDVTITPTLPTGFEQFVVEARGADSIISLGEASENSGCEDFTHGFCLTLVTVPPTVETPILAMGEGTVINNTRIIHSTVDHAALTLKPAQYNDGAAVTLVNNAYIVSRGENADGISGGTNNKIENNAGIKTSARNSMGIRADGALSLINTGTIRTSGELSSGMWANFWTNNPEVIPTVVNSGTIETSGRYSYGLGLFGTSTVMNSGEIRTSGRDSAAAILSGGSYGHMEFENSGLLQASGENSSAVVYHANLKITNSGTLQSLQDAAISNYTSYSDNVEIINSATGQIIGGNGTAIRGYSSNNFSLDNAGSITGDVVFHDPNSNDYYCDSETVTNRGTITGSVIFGRCNDTFIHDGGTVSGVVDLGDDNDTFILNLDTGAKLSDIAGGVIAGDGMDTLAYSSEQEVSVNLAPVAGFEAFSVIAESEDSIITLTSTADFLTEYLTISGEGTVINTANFKRDLLASNYDDPTAIVTVNTGATFTNKASIELSEVTGTDKYAITVNLGATFTNEGTITAMADDATGINIFGTLINTGTVTTGTGPAVRLSGFLENSGSLTSQGQAINLPDYYGSSSLSTIHNKSTGIIEGQNGQAIGTGYYYSNKTAVISNAGQIIGDITLGNGNDTYIANGGFLEGNLFLGSGDDVLFVNAGAENDSFLSGTVDAGYGSDAFGLIYHQNADAELVQHTGFEKFAIGVIGENTIVTLKETGQTVTGAIEVAGNGTLINEMDISAGTAFNLRSAGVSFINTAMINGVTGNAQDISVTNDGTILSFNYFPAINLANATGTQVINNGTIEQVGSGYNNPLVQISGTQSYYSNSSAEIFLDGADHNSAGAQAALFRNDGTITGGGIAMQYLENITFENNGQIKSLTNSVDLHGSTIDASNTGSIIAYGNNTDAVRLSYFGPDVADAAITFLNEGTIQTSGLNSNALYVYYGAEAQLINRGEISTTGGPDIYNGINYNGDAYQNFSINSAVNFWNGSLVNEQGATIEVTKMGSVAVNMGGYDNQVSLLENAGNILGTDGIEYTDYYGAKHFVAGAILGNGAQQIIRNSGLIKGSVDLGGGDDVFEMTETGVMDGQVDGGAGEDHILLNFAADAAFNGSQYLNFETLNKTGSGNFSLSGILDIAEVTITEGMLSGTGTITGNVTNMGTISPGNSPGTLTIEGTLTMTEGSRLLIESGDLLNVMGDASLTGSILQLVGDIGAVNGEFLAVAGTVDGQFSSLILPDNNSALFKHVSIVYSDQTATLVVADQFAAIDGAMKNSSEVKYIAALMDSELSDDTFAALTQLSSLTTSSLENALGQMTGESHAAATRMGLTAGQAMVDSYRGRFAQHQAAKGMTLWAEGLGSFDRQNADGALSGYATNLYGFLTGLDYGISDTTMIGLSIGYTDGRQSFTSLRANNDYKSYNVGAHASYQLDHLRFGAAFTYGSGEVESERTMEAGVLNGTARAEYDLNYYTAQGELAYDLGLETLTVEPRAGLSWTSVSRKAAEETGLAGLNLAFDDAEYQVITSHVGVRFAKSFSRESGVIFTPELNIGWDYDVQRDSLSTRSYFAGNSGAFQSHFAADSGKSRFVVGAGMTGKLSNGIIVYARYSGHYNGQEKRHQANLGLGITF